MRACTGEGPDGMSFGGTLRIAGKKHPAAVSPSARSRDVPEKKHRSGAPSGEGATTVAAVADAGPDPGADAQAAVGAADGAAEPSGPAMADEAASGYNLVEDVDAVFERIRGRVADFERESGRQVVVMALYSYGRFRESGRQVPARLNKLI